MNVNSVEPLYISTLILLSCSSLELWYNGTDPDEGESDALKDGEDEEVCVCV